ncbi:MAG: endonuclease/exonuclease/phosphatase family protein [Caldilinea sp.]
MAETNHLWLLIVAIALALLAPLAAVAQESEPIPVYILQGDGAATPLSGRYVDSVGVVTGVGSAGFYLQDPAGDGRSETSDGIYVYTRKRPAVAPGDCVLVRGALIDEFYEKSELSRVKAIEPSNLCRTTMVAPAPFPTLPYAASPHDLYEAYEGMLVSLPPLSGVVHGPTKRYASGEAEIALALSHVQPYVSDGRVFFDEPVEQAQLLYVSSALGAPLPDLNYGDFVRIAAMDGDMAMAILDYNFGKYQLLLLPGSVVERTEPSGASPTAADPAGEQDFTICSYNLKGMGSGSAQYLDPTQYALELRRRATTIADWLSGCTVIGLQESGQPRDVEQLAALLGSDFGLDYAATALPSPQSSNPEFPLTNAFLTRADRVQVLGAESPQSCSPLDYEVVDPGVCPAGQFPLFDRPPLVVDLAVQGGWGDPVPITLIVNHWKSKAGDESANLPRRIAQARQVAALAQEKLAANVNAAVVVLGDLNDYYGSEPVETVRTVPEPDLVHLYDRLPPLDRYSYIFNGASQVLDHMLVSPALAGRVGEVTIVRLSAGYAAPLAPTADNVFHASDHDPVVVRVWPRGVGWIAGNVRYAGVRAELLDGGGRSAAQATSDERGDFRLWNVAPGDYRLVLSAPPHLELAMSDVAITVISGENRFVTTARHQASLIGSKIATWSAAPFGQP